MAKSARFGRPRPLESRVPEDSDSEDDSVAFVQTAIKSVCALELLILLRRERQRVYRADQLVRELRSSELAVAQALEHLASKSRRNSTPSATAWNPTTRISR